MSTSSNQQGLLCPCFCTKIPHFKLKNRVVLGVTPNYYVPSYTHTLRPTAATGTTATTGV